MGLDSVCRERDWMRRESGLEKRNEARLEETKTIDHVGAFGPHFPDDVPILLRSR